MILLLILKALVLGLAISSTATLVVRAMYKAHVYPVNFFMVAATWALFYLLNALSMAG